MRQVIIGLVMFSKGNHDGIMKVTHSTPFQQWSLWMRHLFLHIFIKIFLGNVIAFLAILWHLKISKITVLKNERVKFSCCEVSSLKMFSNTHNFYSMLFLALTQNVLLFKKKLKSRRVSVFNDSVWLWSSFIELQSSSHCLVFLL
jgi:hypothetical protein